jgi:hypothetical protein
MVPLPPRALVFAVSVSPIRAVPLIVTDPVRSGQITELVGVLVTLPPRLLTVTVMVEFKSAAVRI